MAVLSSPKSGPVWRARRRRAGLGRSDGSGQAAEQLPLAALSASRNAELAAAFVNFVLPDEGQDTLESYGFNP